LKAGPITSTSPQISLSKPLPAASNTPTIFQSRPLQLERAANLHAVHPLEDPTADDHFVQPGLKVPAVGHRDALPDGKRHLRDAAHSGIDVLAVLAAQVRDSDELGRGERPIVLVARDAGIVGERLHTVAGDTRRELRARAALRHDGIRRRSGRAERDAEAVRHGDEHDEHGDHERDAADRERGHLPADIEAADVVGQRQSHSLKTLNL
jgi:hypothetical protein